MVLSVVFVPSDRKYFPLLCVPASAFIAACCVIAPVPPCAIVNGAACHAAAVLLEPTNNALLAGVPLTLTPLIFATVGLGYVPLKSPLALPLGGYDEDGVLQLNPVLCPLAAVNTCPSDPTPNRVIVLAVVAARMSPLVVAVLL
jgi:hypothetical protein